MERSDWTLLVISASGNRGLSPVRLQKALFLLGQNCRDAVGDYFYTFIPYNYGPFDAAVYSDAEALAELGLVSIAPAPGGRWSEYTATLLGLKKAQELERQIPSAVARYLCEVVAWVRKLSFQTLVRSIYQAYPEFRINSVFHD